ncbi:hypothetical protein FNF27_06622 [Cafeteria roenbergensis]|uniref:Uncharacterized protein n=1 Tax=Cafeteria roenbergensis TaxID=33653 RepID=A0A5A8DK19_CAFRO|nr:hypothetical protein FNF31_01679 [Cafeteria roenbergensis]KAA0170365.1 hypothetical protein FNF27_06622 [Cafeteria roenbergensis]
MAAVVRKKAMNKAPAVGVADMLRIAPQSPFSCRGPYIVTNKDDNSPFAQIRLISNISNDISVSWEVDVTSAGDNPRPLTKSTHQENAATKEWEVAVRDGNGTTMYEYAYKRFNPALGAQRMNVTDANGVIVAFIEYVTRSELRVHTCMDSESTLVGGTVGPADQPTPSPAPPKGKAGAKGASLLQQGASPAPNPEVTPSPVPRRSASLTGPCARPRETARLTQSWGDSAAHAWTLQRFQRVEGQPPPAAKSAEASPKPSPGAAPTAAAAAAAAAAAEARFAESRASMRAHQFLHDDYDVMLLLELAALVSHDEAPWCLAVTSAYVVIIACCVLIVGIGVAWMLSRPATRRRSKRKRRRPAESQADKSRRALEEAFHGKSL